jgi:hypothetical protein
MLRNFKLEKKTYLQIHIKSGLSLTTDLTLVHISNLSGSGTLSIQPQELRRTCKK